VSNDFNVVGFDDDRAVAEAVAGQAPAPAAFNPALTRDQVLAAVAGIGFIS
jgi:hypothetical protein